MGQLFGEIPYSILCAIVYWLLMVSCFINTSSIYLLIASRYQVWPMGFGQGSAGTNGNGFQLLVIIFMELFGGTLFICVKGRRPDS